MKYKNRTNKETNIQEQINNQTKKKELIKMEDNDDHNEDEDEVVVVHSSVVDDHSHKVQVEVMGHYIVAVEKDVVVEVDHMMVVDEYRVDNLFVDHNKVVHEDYHMEDIAVDVAVQDNVEQVDEEVVAN